MQDSSDFKISSRVSARFHKYLVSSEESGSLRAIKEMP